jgi:hypothetical protein
MTNRDKMQTLETYAFAYQIFSLGDKTPQEIEEWLNRKYEEVTTMTKDEKEYCKNYDLMQNNCNHDCEHCERTFKYVTGYSEGYEQGKDDYITC